MDRAKILAMIDLAHGRGLEIGALNRPVITRDMGAVEYIDRAPTEELRRWYAINDEVDVDQIVDVDHVWGSQTLFECVGRQRIYDYLVASHVIEHVPDLFGWLGEIASVLADGGIASFVVPDKRFTFDVLRRTSGDSELVDAYVRGLRRPEARQIFDHFYGFRDLGSEAVRGGASPADLPPTHDARELMELCRRTQENGEYIDTHCWVFTPSSFVDALDLGSRLGVLPFEIASVIPTPEGSHEFFVALRRLPDSAPEAQRAAFVASRETLWPRESGDPE
ncbi:MAG: methyltransferase domain-containing protein, partial [Phenylobacterium sp.]|uniref:methyltransferase domain-containing protein n=1 Tax=Phenylobacterium sp. TaxID=1871053 RepID=UPI00273605B5